MTIPRNEYPRPQFQRENWICLNGEWQFEMDCSNSGLDRGLKDRELNSRINIPFCPESELSGIGNVDYMDAVWYRKEVVIPADWEGQKFILHFQAVDYDTFVWVNGQELVRHRGGFTPFSCDISKVVKAGETATIVVRAYDNHRISKPRGKQSDYYENTGCHYTRTTGIWQTVWIEPVPQTHLLRTRITPDVANSAIRIEQPVSGSRSNLKYRATISDKDGIINSTTISACSDFSIQTALTIPEERLQLWEPGNGYLYNLTLELLDSNENVIDQVKSYCGMRSIVIDDKKVLINGKSVFQRLVLDQGYYRDGIMTAPTDQALIDDIKLSMEAGFNGARLHQKVFEERFLYHADRLGYLVWGEFAVWPLERYDSDENNLSPETTYITQWLEAVERDYSHPSIIGWCPNNETHSLPKNNIKEHDDRMRGMFLATKAHDLSRPVLDTSGYSHRVYESDIYDSHDYNQNPEDFAQNHKGLAQNAPLVNSTRTIQSIPYNGQPYFVSEFGGILWNPNVGKDEKSWGYGKAPQSIDEWYERFDALCTTLLDNPGMFAYCYTQLTDVFQEQNGIYTFEREKKFDSKKLYDIQMKKAAIEK